MPKFKKYIYCKKQTLKKKKLQTKKRNKYKWDITIKP